ncbi:MAG: restriction endonuclease subunit S [Advenella sp.]
MTGWEIRSLAEVCAIKPPKAEARARLAADCEVSFAPMYVLGIDAKYMTPTAVRPLADVSGSYTYFAEGDVLVAKITPCFENGKLGIAKGLVNGIGFGSSEFIVLRPGSELDREFLYYYLYRSDFREVGARTMTGAVGHKRVAADFIEQLPIPIPPLLEQRRIVAILDDAFDAIATAKANAEKNFSAIQELSAAALNLVFPVGAESAALADLAVTIADGDHMPPPKASTGIPFITISNVDKEMRRIDFTDTYFVSRSYFDGLKPNRRPQAGDVLYTVTGSFGIPVLVEDDREFCFQRHIGLIRPKADTNSRWLSYALLSPGVLAQADAQATGTAQRTVSLAVLRALKVPRVRTDVQRDTVAKLDAVFEQTARLRELSKARLAALDELKQSLLHQAFTGKLTAKTTDKQLEAVA